eukprot:TRINITY_DN12739_c0_g1_i6.p1 TRINITY_DN12739_c0_g1~~TRINITY_DN12739_c0_g1_i6.p1  ORF type:complete len:102 (-),score=12.30 TRINITY_DN12739_c0_g1_i6:144-449(-)
MVNKSSMFFISFESTQPNPVPFQWTREKRTISIRPEDFLYMDELVVIEELTEVYQKKAFILTKYYLFECADCTFKSFVTPVATLELRNPYIKKVENKNKNL